MLLSEIVDTEGPEMFAVSLNSKDAIVIQQIKILLLCLKGENRVSFFICLIAYYGFAYWLPSSYSI